MFKKIVFITVIVFAIFVSPLSAFAWSNGTNYGNGFGTHDWVVYEAAKVSKNPKWFDVNAAMLVSDDPDTQYHDYYYHVYDIWGKRYGNSPSKANTYFKQAKYYYHLKNYKKASQAIGLLSHYYADTCDPLHTDSCATEDKMHSRYESAVQTRIDTKGENRSWIKYDGYNKIKDVTLATQSAGKWSHNYYSSLVSNYNRSSYNSTVNTITKRSLNKAVNGLSDIILSVPK